MNFNIQLAQFIAYSALTLSSLTVAIVSLLFSYRQNFGWNPITLVTNFGFASDQKGRHVHHYFMKFEVWNRRTYPIVVRRIECTFPGVTFAEAKGWNQEFPDLYLKTKEKVYFTKEQLIPAKDHKAFNCEFPVSDQESLNDFDTMAEIVVTYFDPRRNQVVTQRVVRRFSLLSDETRRNLATLGHTKAP